MDKLEFVVSGDPTNLERFRNVVRWALDNNGTTPLYYEDLHKREEGNEVSYNLQRISFICQNGETIKAKILIRCKDIGVLVFQSYGMRVF